MLHYFSCKSNYHTYFLNTIFAKSSAINFHVYYILCYNNTNWNINLKYQFEGLLVFSMGFSIFFTIMKHQKVITVNDGWDAVCDCDNGATFEFGAQSVLDESIGSTVN